MSLNCHSNTTTFKKIPLGIKEDYAYFPINAHMILKLNNRLEAAQEITSIRSDSVIFKMKRKHQG